uniref:Uncharacterized protein n=1 Tax=Triticum urartu TaxID=4572 RepID=A0A8R7P396_TRIUA
RTYHLPFARSLLSFAASPSFVLLPTLAHTGAASLAPIPSASSSRPRHQDRSSVTMASPSSAYVDASSRLRPHAARPPHRQHPCLPH